MYKQHRKRKKVGNKQTNKQTNHKGSDSSPENKKPNIMTDTEPNFSSLAATAQLLTTSQNILSENCDNEPKTITDLWTQMNTIQQSLSHIACKVDKLDNIERRLTGLEDTLNQVIDKVQQLEAGFNDLEQGMTFINEKYEQFRIDNTELAENVRSNEKKIATAAKNEHSLNERVRTEFAEVKINQNKITEDITDLQCRSMRDNLLFFNIEETANEACMDTIQRFCKQKLNIQEDIEIDRAHRLGKRCELKTRPIVVKFRKYPQREMVQKQSKRLKGTDFSISEQFPKPIQERRRKLMPTLKQARSEGKKANLVKDKLYIDGNLYVPAE